MRLLKKARAVEVRSKGYYCPSVLSKQFRLAEKFIASPEALVVRDPLLLRRMDEVFSLGTFKQMKGPGRQWIVKSYLKASFGPHSRGVRECHVHKSAHAANTVAVYCELFMQRALRFSVGETSGRVHYPVTSLPKAFRACIVLDGEPCIEIDVRASQPSLLAALYPASSLERIDYLAFLASKDIYTEAKRWVAASWSRDDAKVEVLRQIAYGPVQKHPHYPLWREFEHRFPELASIMCAIKRRGPSVLPLQMQALEASIVIDGVCGECAKRRLPVLPVHDSVICPATRRDEVGAILTEAWTRVCGFPPILK